MHGSEPVSSTQNSRLRAVRALRAGRDRAHLLLEGRRVVGEALDAGLPLQWLLAAEDALSADPELAALAARAREAGAELVPCAPALMREAGDLDSPADLLGWAERPDADAAAMLAALQPGAWLLAAAGVQDPGNVGALARVAAGLGAAGFIAGTGSASPWHPRAVRGASGTCLRLPVAERADLLALAHAAQARGAAAWAADAAGEDARGVAAAWRAEGCPPALLILGEEGRGLPADLAGACARRVAVPLARGVESLNVATAAAVLGWELFARGPAQ
jgi:TrmH family RNA methyltransferase